MFDTCNTITFNAIAILFILVNIALLWGIHKKNHWCILTWLILIAHIIIVAYLKHYSYYQQLYENSTTENIIWYLIYSAVVFGVTVYVWISIFLYYIDLIQQEMKIYNDKNMNDEDVPIIII